MGLLERADLALARAVGRLDPEHLDLHPLRGHGGRIDDHERTLGARRLPVNGARGELLAGAGRAHDQNPAVGGCHLVHGLTQLVDRGRVPDQGGRRQLLERLDLALEAGGLERAVGDQHQAVGLERLLDEIVGPALDGGDRGLDIAVARDHHHRNLGIFPFDGVEHLQAVEPAALQPDVEKHQVGPARRNGRERVVAVARGARQVALILQDAGHQLADIRFVVNDEDV